ncbi:hypothetical protein ACROYT_G015367 [Oculina patagonica]
MVGSCCVVQGCSNGSNKAAGIALHASPTDKIPESYSWMETYKLLNRKPDVVSTDDVLIINDDELNAKEELDQYDKAMDIEGQTKDEPQDGQAIDDEGDPDWTPEEADNAYKQDNKMTLSLAILCSGASINKVLLVFKHMGVPSIVKYWRGYQAELLTKLKGEEVVLAGDGRHDSMGHSASMAHTPYSAAPLARSSILCWFRY